MMYLLDTNVISELRKQKRAHRNVRAWQAGISPSAMFLSVITIMELEQGVRQKERKDPRQGSVLRNWLDRDLLLAFDDRILPVDTPVALRCASLHERQTKPYRDAFIAATALEHKLTVVTRNVANFERTGVTIINPWQ